nr:ribonuclease H-like domain-containing protein [Tanacetum cinerariifolium]
IKWNMTLLSMRADRFWKKTGKKITIQGSDVASFDKSKVECFNCHKMGHFARECRAPRSQERGKKESYKQGPKEEEPAPKALMAIDGIGWDWSYMANKEENHDLVADDEVPTKFALMAKLSSSSDNEYYVKIYDQIVEEADCPRVIKNNNTENARKSTVKYAEMYRNISKGPKVRGNQRNWNNLKSQQLGKDFLMQNKACFKCGYFDHLESNCDVWVDNGETWPKDNYTHKSMTPRAVLLKPGITPIVPPGFQDLEFLERVYKVENAMYGLHRAPRAWYDQETKIIATVDGKPWTISESSLRRHLKLNDKEGISSLHDDELFENLSLMGYNILPNQSNIATAVVCLATNMVYNFPKMILMGEGLANSTEPYHIPSPQDHQSPQHDSLPLSHQTIIPELIPHDLQVPTKTLTPRRLTKRAIRIAQSKALSPTTDEPASLSRDNRHGEAFLTVFSLDAWQDRENIAKTSAMSHESSPRVPSLDADKGSIQQRLHELMELCTSLQRQHSQIADKIKDQDIKISGLKARVKSLEDKERRHEEPIQEDAPITGGIIDIEEELGADKSTEKGSNDTEEMVNVLSSKEAANILSSGGAAILIPSVSPADVFPTVGVPTVNGSFPNPMRIPIISAKDKGKEKVTETKVPKKKKLQEQIDDQVARQIKEEFARENQRSNEVIAKHLSEYEQAEADLSVGEKVELISELVKYQDHLAEILKYQAQQSKPS